MRTQAGFTLVELIASIVLLGFIAVFGSIFLSTGIRGALNTKQAQENAIKAQIALDRIALELRDINAAPTVSASGPSITYTSALSKLTGSRVLAYNSGTKAITLAIDAGTARTLVDGVSACTMTTSGTTYSSTLTVTFTLSNSPNSFSITVRPRQTGATPISS